MGKLDSNTPVVVKEAKPESMNIAINEANILTELLAVTDSDYFVKLIGVVADFGALKLVFEYIEGESLDLFLFSASME